MTQDSSNATAISVERVQHILNKMKIIWVRQGE